jgi:anti-sigma regulatory factor (Ser/Thr protein kinase)
VPRAELELPQNTSSTSLARKRTGDMLRDAQQSNAVRDEAELIVTELVTNAILHGRAPIRLTIVVDDTIRLEVFDSDARVEGVVMQPIDPHRIGGRGLVLVDAIADTWGTIPHNDGKTIWANLLRVDDISPLV